MSSEPGDQTGHIPPMEGWNLRDALREMLDPDEWVRLSLADECERHYRGRLSGFGGDPRPMDRVGTPVDVAGLRDALRQAEDQLALSRAFAIHRLREVMAGGAYEAEGRRGDALGEKVEIPGDVWSAFDWFDLETSAVGEARDGGARIVALRIRPATTTREVIRPAQISPYPTTTAPGRVADAFDAIRPDGRHPAERFDQLADALRSHLHENLGRTTIKKGIEMSNKRHGRPAASRGGDRRSSRARGNPNSAQSD